MDDQYKSHIDSLVSNDHRISVGRFTYGNPSLKVWGENESVSIGAFCSIADDVVIFGGGEHRKDWITTFPLRIAFGDALAGLDGHPTSKGPTCIGNDVWIGHGACVLSGVTIGDGAIIGARAVVAHDVLPYTIVGGNPAKILKRRFTDRQITALLAIRWWDWPVEEIHARQHLLCSDNIDAFIEAFIAKAY